MHYMLDTNIISQLINIKSPYHERVRSRLLKCQKSSVYVSVISECEVMHGIQRIDKRKASYIDRIQKGAEFVFTNIPTLSLTSDVSEYYGLIRACLQSKGQEIGAMDALIAAHAMATDCTLVSDNEKHFKRIQHAPQLPKLKLQNWIQ